MCVCSLFGSIICLWNMSKMRVLVSKHWGVCWKSSASFFLMHFEVLGCLKHFPSVWYRSSKEFKRKIGCFNLCNRLFIPVTVYHEVIFAYTYHFAQAYINQWHCYNFFQWEFCWKLKPIANQYSIERASVCQLLYFHVGTRFAVLFAVTAWVVCPVKTFYTSEKKKYCLSEF